MPRVIGYADPLSVAPGEPIRFMVGTVDGPRRYRAEVVRLVCGDTGPGGPGLKTVRLPTSAEARTTSARCGGTVTEKLRHLPSSPS